MLNNILINQHPWRGSIVVASSALTGFVCDFNLVTDRLSPDGDATILDLTAWQALGHDANSAVAGPEASLFVAPGSDLHPLSASAQMVDAGTAAVSAVVAEDLDGTPRPLGNGFDIGCYENDLGTALSMVPFRSTGFRFDGTNILLPADHTAAQVLFFTTDGRLVDQRSVVGSARVEAPATGVGLAVFSTVDHVPVGVVKWCGH